jgi:hypothetical protein
MQVIWHEKSIDDYGKLRVIRTIIIFIFFKTHIRSLREFDMHGVYSHWVTGKKGLMGRF